MTDHRKGNKYLKLLRDTGQLTEHYKMYKAGKNWLFAGISLLTFGAGVAINQASVKADTVMADSSSEPATTATTNAASSSSVVTLKAASDSSATSDTTTSASSTSDTDSSAADTSSANDLSSAAATATNSNTSSSSAAAANTAAASDSSAVSSAASDETTKLATLQTELPAGTTFTTQSDGSTLIELPVSADIDSAKAAVAAAGLTDAVTVTAKDADATPLTAPISYGTSTANLTTTSVYGQFGSPITMADFAFMQAVGTGTFYDEAQGGLITNATVDQLLSYFDHLDGTSLIIKDNDPSATLITEFNLLSKAYYYFMGSSDSYINTLTKKLAAMTTDTASNLSNAASSDQIDDWFNVVEQDSEFWSHFFLPAGNLAQFPSAGDGVDPDAAIGTWQSTKPAGLTTDEWTGIESFINGTVGLYISAIIPGAQQYVLDIVLPAVNAVSDTSSYGSATTSSAVLAQIKEQSYQLAHALMTIDGDYSLTTIIPHIASMYKKGSDVGGFIGTVVSNLMSGKTLGEFVGALKAGTAVGWVDATKDGEGVAYPNFTVFNNLYLAYSEAIIQSAYGYAMVGKYDAIKAMYTQVDANGNVVTDGSGTQTLLEYEMNKIAKAKGTTADKLAPTDLTAQAIHDALGDGSTIPVDTLTDADGNKLTSVAETTYDQGIWDTYNYILPFYEQAQSDLKDGTSVTGDPTLTDYINAVYNKVMANYKLNDTTGAALTTSYTDTDTTDTNPHDVTNYVSDQTKAYLVSFYSGLSATPDTLNYQVQAGITTQYEDSDGNIVKTTFTPSGDKSDALTCAFGDPVDATSLPDTITINGVTYNWIEVNI